MRVGQYWQSALLLVSLAIITSCSIKQSGKDPMKQSNGVPNTPAVEIKQGKPVIYQMFTRLFGNKNNTNLPWGTIEQNGVGKFNDITDAALSGIAELGVTHIWYTGVAHHALVRDYQQYGISNDDPDVVKGRAGSPYAVKDYYNVNPDLAVNPANRLAEFEALINRTHAHNMKVIIDIVPNHVARRYESVSLPEGVNNFGQFDDTTVEYARDNNFYYVPSQHFTPPQYDDNKKPLGGEDHELSDGAFFEFPAKWTGNGARSANPSRDDWYETVKINYGVKPDGSFDFPSLPAGYATLSTREHLAYWSQHELPDSWYKFRDIALYWLSKGVDGFRFDMAEMVPVEFWSFLNSSIKQHNPEAFLLAEVYQPQLYRDYLFKGKMDYLYDKVEFYDTLKGIMKGNGDTAELDSIQHQKQDIAPHMLHFLENHDEQRIASPEFAGDATIGKPALVVSALISASPTMIYFGQEVGEDGSEAMGYGDPSRTSIFDYAGVPAHQRWMNEGKFDGGQLSESEKALRDFYAKVLSFSAKYSAFSGHYMSLHNSSTAEKSDYGSRHLAFARWQGDEQFVVVSSFHRQTTQKLIVVLPIALIKQWNLKDGHYLFNDLLSGEKVSMTVVGLRGEISLQHSPLASSILLLQKP